MPLPTTAVNACEKGDSSDADSFTALGSDQKLSYQGSMREE